MDCLPTIEDPSASEVPQFITKHCGKAKGTSTPSTNIPNAQQAKVTSAFIMKWFTKNKPHQSGGLFAYD